MNFALQHNEELSRQGDVFVGKAKNFKEKIGIMEECPSDDSWL
jgi:hypothetical protein